MLASVSGNGWLPSLPIKMSILNTLNYSLYSNTDIKKRGIVLLPIPRVEALALPIKVEQTTSEATPYEDSPNTYIPTP